MLPTNIPSYVSGKKNPTKLSLVVIERNHEVERALEEYKARNSVKVSLKRVAKVEKKKVMMKPTIIPKKTTGVGEAKNVDQLKKSFWILSKRLIVFSSPPFRPSTHRSSSPSFRSSTHRLSSPPFQPSTHRSSSPTFRPSSLQCNPLHVLRRLNRMSRKSQRTSFQALSRCHSKSKRPNLRRW